MREIKFRCWHYTNKRFIYPTEYMLHPIDNTLIPKNIKGSRSFLTQQIGIKDINRVEIYEGDIVSGGDVAVSYDNCTVEFIHGAFVMTKLYGKQKVIEGGFNTPELWLAIVGNIYEGI